MSHTITRSITFLPADLFARAAACTLAEAWRMLPRCSRYAVQSKHRFNNIIGERLPLTGDSSLISSLLANQRSTFWSDCVSWLPPLAAVVTLLSALALRPRHGGHLLGKSHSPTMSLTHVEMCVCECALACFFLCIFKCPYKPTCILHFLLDWM